MNKSLIENWDAADPEYRKAVVGLWWGRRQTSHPNEILYMTAHAFTEDTNLWGYSWACLESLRNWFHFKT